MTLYTLTDTDTPTSTNGGQTCEANGATSCRVPGLTAGDTYTFSVTLTSNAGDSAPSTPSNQIITTPY